MSPRKWYLGDGVYVDYDGFNLVLTCARTNERDLMTHRIVLEPPVFNCLLDYVNALNQPEKRTS